eukprot:gene6883-38424_t
MYVTDCETTPAGPFSGRMVVSMLAAAVAVTSRYPRVHGTPVHVGDPSGLGIADLDAGEGRVPVFWACGVTPQVALENARPPLAITHAPGHMLQGAPVAPYMGGLGGAVPDAVRGAIDDAVLAGRAGV